MGKGGQCACMKKPAIQGDPMITTNFRCEEAIIGFSTSPRALTCDGRPLTRSVQVVSHLTGPGQTRPWLIPLRGYVHLSPHLASPRFASPRHAACETNANVHLHVSAGPNVTCFFCAQATVRHKERKEKSDTTSPEIESVMPTERCWSKSHRSVSTLDIRDVHHFVFNRSHFLSNALFTDVLRGNERQNRQLY